MRLHHLLLVPALLAAMAAPVLASTVPVGDLRAGQHVASVGLLHATYDYGLTDERSAGIFLAPFSSSGLRVTQRLAGDPGGSNVVASMAVGLQGISTLYGPGAQGGTLGMTVPVPLPTWTTFDRGYPDFTLFAMPSVAWAFPLGPIVPRLQLGLALVVDRLGGSEGFILDPQLILLPNAELAIRVAPRTELTLLGMSLIGLRHGF